MLWILIVWGMNKICLIKVIKYELIREYTKVLLNNDKLLLDLCH